LLLLLLLWLLWLLWAAEWTKVTVAAAVGCA
jgi:hypothetical protein